ncbi:MAG: RecQ family ATP-dependent DNA helicase [Acidimicrobiales bacterium]
MAPIEIAEPPRPSADQVEAELTDHVRTLAGPDARPRPEQLSAVTAVVAQRQRTLLVARTGFGKSAVYFSATRVLRDRGWGPTVVVSPLLALMRDQVAAARKLGLNAVTINSSNIDSWAETEAEIEADRVDLLLIAPERLANPGFRARVFDTMQTRAFALVCDEAHCISDWGHDFRPDYRRLRRLLTDLPSWTPVLATTATANQRVTDDVAAQLGDDTLVLRTSLDRASLYLSVVDLADDGHRLAWLAQSLPELPGSGIIYCLTVEQAEATAAWLRSQGHDVGAYTGSVEPEQRLELESALRANDLKALVATSALGMGFDKGDLAFCVHLGLPPSPVAYYQQVGRAGRALDRAEVVALPRPVEDAAVWNWFESVSLPSAEICHGLLDQLDRVNPTSIAVLELTVNLGRSRLGTLLNILEVDGAIDRVGNGWIRTDQNWQYNHELSRSLRELRRSESEQMRDWAGLATCRLRYLREALDDGEADDCGRCDRCTENRWQRDPPATLIGYADAMLRGGDLRLAPRKQWPSGLGEPKGRIPAERQPAVGRALARLGDGGWHLAVQQAIEAADAGQPSDVVAGMVTDEMVDTIAGILKRWDWDDRPTWICPMPSRRRSDLITEVCHRLGDLGNLPVHRALCESGAGPAGDDVGPRPAAGFQADQANSAHQVGNVWGRFAVAPGGMPDREIAVGPVLLVDDETDSRWTMTVAAHLLTGAGSGPVLPFVLRTR